MFCLMLPVFLFWQNCRASTSLSQRCFFPNGDDSPDTPCGPTSSDQASACCAPDDTCLSNRLCFNPELVIYRGSCTDSSWQSYDCAPWCQDVISTDYSPVVSVKYSLFCCGKGNGYFDPFNGTCYNSTRGSDAPFPVDAGRVIYDRSSGSTSLPPPSNDSVTVTSTVTLAGATTDAVTNSTATAAGSAALPPSTLDKEATVGVAVGVPLGMALLGVAGLLWRQMRTTNRLREEKKTLEGKHVALLESKMNPPRREVGSHGSDDRLVRHQLEDSTIGEMPS